VVLIILLSSEGDELNEVSFMRFGSYSVVLVVLILESVVVVLLGV